MRKILFVQNVSLDGFIEDSQGNFDWTMPSEELHWHYNELEKNVDINFYGRRLSETMDYWLTAHENPDAPDVEIDFANAWLKTERIVFSKTLEKVEGNASIRREVDLDEIRKLKNQPGNLLMVGGAGLASTFIKHGLVDEFRVYIYPVIIGGGKPMFQVEKKINLKLIEKKEFEGGIVMLRYQLQNQQE